MVNNGVHMLYIQTYNDIHVYIYIYIWLVVWNIWIIFPIILECHHPN